MTTGSRFPTLAIRRDASRWLVRYAGMCGWRERGFYGEAEAIEDVRREAARLMAKPAPGGAKP